MKRGIVVVLGILIVACTAFPQATGGPDPSKIGVDAAQQMLIEVSVSKLEDVAYWATSMPHDQGFIQIRRFEGSPASKEPLPGEQEAAVKETDRYVLGARVQFCKRGHSDFTIFPVKPIPIEGITKTLSVWAAGRNYNHMLKVVLEDYFGGRRELTMGKLNFMGWKKLTVAVPPGIAQDEYHYNTKRGIKLIGFRIEADPMESYGSYYLYLDDIRAVTDLFEESYRDTDDMNDGW